MSYVESSGTSQAKNTKIGCELQRTHAALRSDPQASGSQIPLPNLLSRLLQYSFFLRQRSVGSGKLSPLRRNHFDLVIDTAIRLIESHAGISVWTTICNDGVQETTRRHHRNVQPGGRIRSNSDVADHSRKITDAQRSNQVPARLHPFHLIRSVVRRRCVVGTLGAGCRDLYSDQRLMRIRFRHPSRD